MKKLIFFSILLIFILNPLADTLIEKNKNNNTNNSVLNVEKTNLTLGEDIIVKVNAINPANKSELHYFVVLYPDLGMNLKSPDFEMVEKGGYMLHTHIEPGEEKKIETRITINNTGNFILKGRIIYYYEDDLANITDRESIIQINVKDSNKSHINSEIPKENGFEIIPGILTLLLISIITKIRKSRNKK